MTLSRRNICAIDESGNDRLESAQHYGPRNAREPILRKNKKQFKASRKGEREPCRMGCVRARKACGGWGYRAWPLVDSPEKADSHANKHTQRLNERIDTALDAAVNIGYGAAVKQSAKAAVPPTRDCSCEN